ncbi:MULTISPECIES: PadR family transcriptional regulator [Vagococcus]|uniref:Transcriptional regulator, PadR family n=1 Tax=Vagococcus fluvialis bH819 TaxID=1255619 RepID=A0A1X6WR52_9ENTE|nr:MULTISPECIES: PadR family transcriptional regulator [Vagococcus]SLM86755.1 Transcriptional regulator, PadR family [Vagococcus fluvialis bH819]HCM88785.1 PadR family transcriptional regulator [Vagococcus sp.]
MKENKKNNSQGRKRGRKVDSYLLLFLAKKDCYGGELVTMCEELIPNNQFDSAMVYRTLKKLGEESAIISSYKEVDTKMIRFYSMTEYGRTLLQECKKNVLSNIENLNFFLEEYEKLEE